MRSSLAVVVLPQLANRPYWRLWVLQAEDSFLLSSYCYP
ncbi:hypothetical protein FN3523_0772 [Francisella hispaniensis]|uniref:Uncharacterized protein n=1 Tax=Francisella hispaniensis TaxID=622488 RepID=F4BKD5_9GAMM|nr:hypothetical protein FN3523_0772 [Francisella hispaniensis]